MIKLVVVNQQFQNHTIKLASKYIKIKSDQNQIERAFIQFSFAKKRKKLIWKF